MLKALAVHHLDILSGDCGDTTSGLSLLTYFTFLHSHTPFPGIPKPQFEWYVLLRMTRSQLLIAIRIDPWNEVRSLLFSYYLLPWLTTVLADVDRNST
jgi:hypothetical protein